MKTFHCDYDYFYGKMWVIISLLVVIPILLFFYLIHDVITNITDVIALFTGLILSCFLTEFLLIRNSIKKLARLSDETGDEESGATKKFVKTHSDREMNHIPENVISVPMEFNKVKSEARERLIPRKLDAKYLFLDNDKLQESYRDTLYRRVIAAENKDEDTGDHIMRMSRYCALIAQKLGLSSAEVRTLKYASPMHDVGKIGIPDNILLKKGKLSEEEFELIKTHTIIGFNILANSDADIIQMAQKIALSHHEKWNGSGYPYGLSGEQVDLEGRIVCLADNFDALISKRPYKNPYPLEVTCDIIANERGKHFDPQIVDVFLNNIDELIQLKKEVDSSKNIIPYEFTWSERDQIVMS